MGYYPYEQECIHGHRWGAAFCSVSPMSDSGQKRCPECGCYKVRTVWYPGQDCHMRHNEKTPGAVEVVDKNLKWNDEDPKNPLP